MYLGHPALFFQVHSQGVDWKWKSQQSHQCLYGMLVLLVLQTVPLLCCTLALPMDSVSLFHRVFSPILCCCLLAWLGYLGEGSGLPSKLPALLSLSLLPSCYAYLHRDGFASCPDGHPIRLQVDPQTPLPSGLGCILTTCFVIHSHVHVFIQHLVTGSPSQRFCVGFVTVLRM